MITSSRATSVLVIPQPRDQRAEISFIFVKQFDNDELNKIEIFIEDDSIIQSLKGGCE